MPTGAIQVLDTINDDREITYRRGTAADFKREVAKRGPKRDGESRYVVQYLVDNEIVADNQASDGSIRVFDEKAMRAGRSTNPKSGALETHMREVAEETGLDWPAPSDERKIRYKGKVIEVWYNQASASPWAWKAWVKGIGESSGTSEDEAIMAAKAKVDREANPKKRGTKSKLNPGLARKLTV